MPETLRLYPSALARDAALDAQPAAAWTGEFLTFTEFAGELDRLLPGRSALQIAGGAARHGFLLRGLDTFDAADRARYASDAALQSAGKLIAGWRSYGLAAEQVRRAAQALPQPCAAKETMLFLSNLYAAYERLLNASGWTDREGAERQLLSRIEKCARIPARLLETKTRLSLHGFHRLIPFQRAILERVVALGHIVEVHVALPADATGAEHARERVRASFGALTVVADPQLSPARHAKLVAPSPYAEAYEIGRRVRRWICDEGIAPASICVAVRDLGAYSQALNDVFRRFAIPFFQRRGEPIAFQPIVRVALSALDACVNGLTRADVFRFLCSGPVNLERLLDKRRAVDGAALHALALDARIDRFFGAEVQAPAAEWKKRLEHFEHTAEKPSPWLTKALVSIVEQMDALRSPKTVAKHAAVWSAFFDKAGLSTRAFPESSAPGSNEKDRLSLLELEKALQSLQHGALADSAPMPLDAFASLLNLEIQEHSVRADGAERCGVRVLNLYDLRGLSFKKMVLAGMSEGIFPAINSADPLLGRGSEHDIRSALMRLTEQLGIAHLEPRLSNECEAEERALFQIACGAASGGEIIFSRPQTHFDGRLIGPSLFWTHTFASAETLPEECAKPIHPAPALTQCLTREEVELRSAWILGNGGTDATEAGLAMDVWGQSNRLSRIASIAAIERRRQLFFARQGLALPDASSPREASSKNSAHERLKPGAYDGMLSITAPEIREQMIADLTREAGANKSSLSPSALETLAQCNFKYLVDRVLRVKEIEEPDGELSASDRGSLWHTVLAKFYGDEIKRVSDSGDLVFRMDPVLRADYLVRLRAIAADALEHAPKKMFTGHPGFWGLQKKQIDRLLGSWLEHELFSNQKNKFYVAAAEFKFGPETGQPVSIPLHDSESGKESFLLLQGRIDRLDFQIDDVSEKVPCISAIRVIDYKIGRGSNYSKNIEREKLSKLLLAQLPIYFKAALNHVEQLEKAGRIRADWERIYAKSRAGYYCLKDLPVSVKDEEESVVEISEWPLELKAFLTSNEEQSLFSVIRKKVGAVLNGDFSVQPVECKSPYCPARFICRFQDVPADGAASEGAD